MKHWTAAIGITSALLLMTGIVSGTVNIRDSGGLNVQTGGLEVSGGDLQVRSGSLDMSGNTITDADSVEFENVLREYSDNSGSASTMNSQDVIDMIVDFNSNSDVTAMEVANGIQAYRSGTSIGQTATSIKSTPSGAISAARFNKNYFLALKDYADNSGGTYSMESGDVVDTIVAYNNGGTTIGTVAAAINCYNNNCDIRTIKKSQTPLMVSNDNNEALVADGLTFSFFNSGGTVGIDGNLNMNGYNINNVGSCSNCDLAESIKSEEEYEKGTFISISDTEDNTVEISDEEYDSDVVGVVSTNPVINMGSGEGGVNMGVTGKELNTSDGEVPVALAGVVPVKVNDKNGDIERGDAIVPSSEKGVGMKADTDDYDYSDLSVIGKAMEPMDDNQGKINVLVN